MNDFKSKVIGHWYCTPDSDYQEIIFTDSAFMAVGGAYGQMFRYLKYIYPDSIHIYNTSGIEDKGKVAFHDSTMTATFSGGQTIYSLISRLTDHERDYELLLGGNERSFNILYTEWLSRMAFWASGASLSRWQVNERILSLFEKETLLDKVDDSFVKAMFKADSSYKATTLPLFHFFDADSDSSDEIAFWGTAGASDTFLKIYKAEGDDYREWIHEYGKLIYCASFRDTTWIEIYSPVMVGDEDASDSVVTFTIAKNYMKREAR